MPCDNIGSVSREIVILIFCSGHNLKNKAIVVSSMTHPLFILFISGVPSKLKAQAIFLWFSSNHNKLLSLNWVPFVVKKNFVSSSGYVFQNHSHISFINEKLSNGSPPWNSINFKSFKETSLSIMPFAVSKDISWQFLLIS